MAHKYKIIQTLFSSNFIYRVRYMIFFSWFIYIRLLVFYTELTHLTQKLKKKKRLNGTCGAKLKSNFYIKLTHLTQKFKNLNYIGHMAQN